MKDNDIVLFQLNIFTSNLNPCKEIKFETLEYGDIESAKKHAEHRGKKMKQDGFQGNITYLTLSSGWKFLSKI